MEHESNVKSRLVLRSAETIFSDIIQKGYFERYDTASLQHEFINFNNSFKIKNGRTPFIYELFHYFFRSLDPSLRQKVLELFYEKDYNWFITTGQYLLFNLYSWIKELRNVDNLHDNSAKISQFLNVWWGNFHDIELNGIKETPSSEYPTKILLELTNNCNLDCIMCGVGRNPYDAKKNLSLDLVKSLCNDVLKKVSYLRLNGLGESTILPNFLEYLELISGLPLQLEIVTNLNVKNQLVWKKLIDANTNFLISCDSSNPRIYETIRRRASFSVFKHNLKLLSDSISHPLQAQIIFTLMKININEIQGVMEMALDFGLGGVIINVVKSEANNQKWIDNNFDLILQLFYKASSFAKKHGVKLKLPDHLGNFLIDTEISNPSSKNQCFNPWKEVYIRYNGDATVCNMLNPYIYGNLNLMSFEDLWSGANSQMFRKLANTRIKHPYCKDCYYLQ